MDGIGGCSCNKTKTIAGRVNRERLVQGQGIGGPAGVALWGENVDMAQPFAGLHEGFETWGQVTIVIGDQDTHADIVGGQTRSSTTTPSGGLSHRREPDDNGLGLV